MNIPVQMLEPLELARRIPNPCLYRGGKRIAVHTQPAFKNKTKPHSCCLSEQGKRVFLLLLKLLRSVEQEGCDSCRWEGRFQLICDKIPPGFFSHLDLISTGIKVTQGVCPSVCPVQSPGELFRGKMRLTRNIESAETICSWSCHQELLKLCLWDGALA